ncbi:DUF4124 domain-containing protein [Alcanivorax sp.]|uniref:DUF4124 domain-containing protein n=1 Tax=Alcanivorax sp. TaxID=1872427 RepID=UPI0019BB785A|nr:DUF4124 domain-containing protein [Alcanivorax sp.]MBD3645600.1 DUF4124 domain-containing protein [Alcanivorax sp.]
MDAKKLFALTRTALWLTMLVSSLAAHGDIFQWRDENGKLHFGDRPPEQVDSEKVTPKTSPVMQELEITVLRQDFTLPDGLHDSTLEAIRSIYRRYRSDFGLDLHGTAQVNLYLFEQQADFRQWMVERIGSSNANYAGVFIPSSNEVAVWRWGDDQDVAQTVLHESSHVLLYQLSPASPVWLHEGLAQYFQTLKVQPDGRLKVSPLTDAQARIRQWMNEGRLITLRQYLSLDDIQWRRMAHELDAIPYTVAWATTAFLMSKPVGRSTLRTLLQELEKTDSRPTLRRIGEIYPGGLTRLEYDFFRWAQSDMAAHWY